MSNTWGEKEVSGGWRKEFRRDLDDPSKEGRHDDCVFPPEQEGGVGVEGEPGVG